MVVHVIVAMTVSEIESGTALSVMPHVPVVPLVLEHTWRSVRRMTVCAVVPPPVIAVVFSVPVYAGASRVSVIGRELDCSPHAYSWP